MGIYKINWEIKSGSEDMICAVGDGVEKVPESRFEFKLIRYKDDKSKMEYLDIQCYEKDEHGQLQENGKVETDIGNLDAAFREFVRYGVVFSNNNELIKLKKSIKENYYKLPKQPVEYDNSTDKHFTELLEEVGHYIECSEQYNTQDECFVPAKDFDEIVESCGYRSYENLQVRKRLKNEGYIRTIGDRMTVVVRCHGKGTRVLSFFRQKLVEEQYLKPNKFDNQQKK